MRATLLLPALTTAFLMGCAGDDPVQPVAPDAPNLSQAAGFPIDIDGAWSYAEITHVVAKPDGEVLNVTCTSPDGALEITQNGSTFTGTLIHPTGFCETKDGQIIPTPWPLPYSAVLSGRITGHTLHIDQYDAPPGDPVHCPKNGTIRVARGQAVELTTTGRCDLSFLPFPFMAKNMGTAIR